MSQRALKKDYSFYSFNPLKFREYKIFCDFPRKKYRGNSTFQSLI